MRSILLKSPAKLNLYLEVLNKRPDGYHEIETVFERISLYDRMRLTLKENGIKLLCDSPGVPANPDNLAYKAAELLKERTGYPGGVEIKLNKMIPPASGLGGGSSNAATVMLGLNELWNLSLSKGELLKLGKEIGSDVPFFLLDRSLAIGRGRGDELVPLPDTKPLWHFLIVPKFRVFTRDVYNCLKKRRLTKRKNIVKILVYALKKRDFGLLEKSLYNRLEEVAVEKHKQIQQVKETLRAIGAKAIAMSGSGPAVFALAQTKEEAMGWKDRFAIASSCQSFVVNTC